MARDEVLIYRDGQRIFLAMKNESGIWSKTLSRSVARKLRNRFASTQHVAATCEKHGYRIESQVNSQLQRRQAPRGGELWSAPAGLTYSIANVLADLGFDVHYERHDLLPEPSWYMLPGNIEPDVGVLRLVQQHDRGLIRYQPNRVSRLNLIRQILLAWPQQTAMIWTSLVDDAKRLHTKLSEEFAEVDLFTGKHHVDATAGQGERHSRIAVTTYGRSILARLQHRELAIVWDAASAVSEQYFVAQTLEKAWKARLYGFLPLGNTLAPFAEQQIAAIFSDREASVPAAGRVMRPVTVAWEKSSGRGLGGRELPTTQIMRAGIWKDRRRNRAVASVAMAAAETQTENLSPAAMEAVSAVCQPPRTVVLVETIEHAVQLARIMPEWPILCAEPNFTGMPAGDQVLLAERMIDDPGRYRCLLVTRTALPRVSRIDLLIRADGGRGILDLDRQRLTDWEDQQCPLAVIDWQDRHHPALRKASKRRRSEYQGAGWKTVGSPVNGTVAAGKNHVARI